MLEVQRSVDEEADDRPRRMADRGSRKGVLGSLQRLSHERPMDDEELVLGADEEVASEPRGERREVVDVGIGLNKVGSCGEDLANLGAQGLSETPQRTRQEGPTSVSTFLQRRGDIPAAEMSSKKRRMQAATA